MSENIKRSISTAFGYMQRPKADQNTKTNGYERPINWDGISGVKHEIIMFYMTRDIEK